MKMCIEPSFAVLGSCRDLSEITEQEYIYRATLILRDSESYEKLYAVYHSLFKYGAWTV